MIRIFHFFDLERPAIARSPASAASGASESELIQQCRNPVPLSGKRSMHSDRTDTLQPALAPLYSYTTQPSSTSLYTLPVRLPSSRSSDSIGRYCLVATRPYC